MAPLPGWAAGNDVEWWERRLGTLRDHAAALVGETAKQQVELNHLRRAASDTHALSDNLEAQAHADVHEERLAQQKLESEQAAMALACQQVAKLDAERRRLLDAISDANLELGQQALASSKAFEELQKLRGGEARPPEQQGSVKAFGSSKAVPLGSKALGSSKALPLGSSKAFGSSKACGSSKAFGNSKAFGSSKAPSGSQEEEATEANSTAAGRAKVLRKSLQNLGDAQANLASEEEAERVKRRQLREVVRVRLDRHASEQAELESRLAGRAAEIEEWEQRVEASKAAERQAIEESHLFLEQANSNANTIGPQKDREREELRRQLRETASVDDHLREELREAKERLWRKQEREREMGGRPWSAWLEKEGVPIECS